MAKVGEGDSRWIVSDRQDGKNCGNWHWEEKDLSTVTHDTIKSKFAGMELLTDGPDGLTVTAKEVSDISGDVSVAQRKGKIFCYFDVKFTLKYKSRLDGETGEGKVTAPEVDHDSFREDFELGVSATDNKVASKKAEAWMRGEGRKAIRAVVRAYFEELFTTHNVGKFLNKIGPAAGSTASAGPVASSAAPAAAAAPAPPKPTPKPKPVVASKSTLSWKLDWRCPVDDLWQVLTDAGRATHYTRAPAKIDPRASGTFEFLGGLISGYYVDVVPNEKLSMQWRLSSWPSGVFNSVIIVLAREDAGVTRMEFAQAGIPEGEFDRVRDGWLRNFWDPIKAVFGFHYDLIE